MLRGVFASSSTTLEELSLSRYPLHWSLGISTNPFQSSACSNRLHWDYDFRISAIKMHLYCRVLWQTVSRWRQIGRLPRSLSLRTVLRQLVRHWDLHLALSKYLEGKRRDETGVSKLEKPLNFVLVPYFLYLPQEGLTNSKLTVKLWNIFDFSIFDNAAHQSCC